MSNFTHLHVHSHYSILDGASQIPELIKRAKRLGMKGLALTDHGNMFGIKEFHVYARKEGIKPILGIETYVAKRTRHQKEKREIDGSGYHLILLAKNKIGYQNLLKLSSIAFTEGFFYRPRIDKELLIKYHEGLIATSACLGGEVASTILNKGEEATEEVITWYKELFGDDYYLEIMLHKADDPKLNQRVYENQLMVNQTIIQLGKKHNIKVVATNDVHFIEKSHATVHDHLLCINTNAKYDDPERLRYTRQEYLKSYEEMLEVFPSYPDALHNTMEIYEKVEDYNLDEKPIMPYFPLPKEYESEGDYLRALVLEGATKRYGTPLPQNIAERIDFELNTIIKMGFPGYFLIVADFIAKARKMGIVVGPGRGSAAGSAVSYCLAITNIDPIKYDLLFERFLNPDRISMPDIDIDFDDEGREKVLDYVAQKYGYKRVAHIITFGALMAKSAIRDIGRVRNIPLPAVNQIISKFPKKLGITLPQAIQEDSEFRKYVSEAPQNIQEVINLAMGVEGIIRQVGTHACGIIISREDLDNYIPVYHDQKSKLLITQYEGKYLEQAGMLKMDFLGLKTLSIIKECLGYIEETTGKKIDIDNIPLDDELTYKLFGGGETTAIFQFESPGMKKYLRQLKPTCLEDLVAMNALYRPGPMQYIPSFINRKHGREKITYDHPLMESFLKNTYGITVYQEQVMLLARRLAGFTRGQSDNLRKAMGKKQIEEMNNLKKQFKEGCLNNPEFIEGCKKNNSDPEKLIEKIWQDWEAFAQYAFNKSHSVCYAYLAYQTAYLKANYPYHFMAAVLSNNLNDFSKLSQFTEECKRLNIKILGPSINYSSKSFFVDSEGNIQFGLAAIKGLGEIAAEHIIEERKRGGLYTDIYNFFERIDTSTVNRKKLEALVYAGAFDEFGLNRSVFFYPTSDNQSFLDSLVHYRQKVKNNQENKQPSLFEGIMESIIDKPKIPKTEEWDKLIKLKREKDVIGMYLSEHPLDQFKDKLRYVSNCELSKLDKPEELDLDDIYIAGLVVNESIGTTSTNKPFGKYTLEDYSGVFTFILFGETYKRFGALLRLGNFVLVHAKYEIPSWKKDSEQLEFQVKNVALLTDDLHQIIRNLTINVPLEAITPELINQMEKLISPRGTSGIKVSFVIYNADENEKIELISNKKIALNQQIFQIFMDNDLEVTIN